MAPSLGNNINITRALQRLKDMLAITPDLFKGKSTASKEWGRNKSYKAARSRVDSL